MAIKWMMNEFAGGRRARDQHIIEEMKSSPKCKKPKNVPVQATIANSVHRIRSKVTDNQFKQIFLKSLSITWQNNWNNSGHEITESHIDNIKDYFGAQKTHTDRLHANFHKRNANQANANPYHANKRKVNNGKQQETQVYYTNKRIHQSLCK